MTEIHYSKLADFLKKPKAAKEKTVFLIQGEAMLVQQSAVSVLDCLLDGTAKDIGCEVIDGLLDHIPDALEQVNTYAMQIGPKVVWFKDAKLIEDGRGHQRQIDQIQKALEGENSLRAAKTVFNLCAKLGLDVMAMGPAQALPADLQPLYEAIGEDAVRRLIEVCQGQGWRLAAVQDHIESLEKAIEKGFPKHHFLVITSSERIPKNRKLYKIIQTHGVVVDCHVPLGERRADKMAQETVLRQILDETLQKAGKRLHPSLLPKLIQFTGFNPATFRDNIEKLIDFSGERPEITSADITSVLHRTKSDPIYELTNAVADRNSGAALFFLNALLKADWHPLQMLAALTNQVRRLLIAKDFTRSGFGRVWAPGMVYAQFQNSVVSAIQAYDAYVASRVVDWQAGSTDPNVNVGKGKKGAKKEGAELVLAPNPSNAYPVYQTLLKSHNYGYQELIKILMDISDVDVKLKSTGQDAGLLMKHLVLSICSPSSNK